MSTFDFRPKFSEILEQAYDVLQVGQDGETLTADLEERGRKAYNFLVREWQAQGLHLWTYTEGVLFLQQGQAEYTVGTDRFTNTRIRDALTVDAADSATSITVSDGTQFTNADNIGVVQDSGVIFWTTIDGVPAGNVITLTTGIDTAASTGAVVFAYNDTFMPISRVLDCRRYDGRDQYEIEVNFEGRNNYFNLPDKLTQGAPVQVYYSRQNTMELGDIGRWYVWDNPDSGNWTLSFTYERKIKVIETKDDFVDFPDYWVNAIVYGLADKLSLRMGVSTGIAQEVKLMAQQTLDQSLSFDNAVYDLEIRVGE